MNKKEFKLNKIDEVRYYTVPSFEETGLVNHAFTTRDLNLGFNTMDDDEKIKNNFKTICKVLEVNAEDTVLSNQTHKSYIRVVTSDDKGKGLVSLRDYDDVDGLVTNKPGLALFTFYADCVPMFFLDKRKKVVGVAHGGWKGTVGRIAGNMIDTMKTNYGSDPKDILVAIAPSIGDCCFEVNKDVYDKFKEEFISMEDISDSISDNKWNIDLKKANRIILEDKGVPLENITVSRMCTSCKSDIFFSYRKENGKTGRMSATIVLK